MSRPIDVRALYDALGARQRHRPTERDGFATAAARLASEGLKPRDVAAALGLTEAAVAELPAAGRAQTERMEANRGR